MHPEVIYDVLDFRDLARTARNQVVYEIVSRQRIQKLVNAYRAAFAKLARNPHPKKPTREEQNIMLAMKKLNHKHSLRELSRNLRAQTGQRDNIVKGLLAADTFLPKMEMIFSNMGLPPELTRLSLVESSFNLKAISRVGATGVWQFMPKSGKEYLVINEGAHIDERLSPLKSTVAAAKLLKRSQKLLGSWALTITSYNHGYSGIRNIPAAAKTSDRIGRLFTGCSKPRGRKLGWASRNYYQEFLAVLYAESYRHIFYGELPQAASPSIVFYQIKNRTTAAKLVLEHGVSMYEFRLFNPDVMNLRTPLPKGFWVALPAERDDFAGLFRTVPRKGRRSLPS
jgi:membrane-bound lytic murein transglycosylase D